MKVRLITLGCPKNLLDSEFLAGGLAKNGVQLPLSNLTQVSKTG